MDLRRSEPRLYVKPAVTSKRWLREAAPALLLVAGLVLIWEGAARYWGVPKYILPLPSEIVASIKETAGPLFLQHSPVTLIECGLGFAMSFLSGILAGGLAHGFPWVRRAIYPILVASQTIPIIVLAPLLVIWFGYGLLPKLILVTVACFFPIAISMVDGLDSAPAAKLKLLRSMGASRAQRFWLVNVPHALPSLFTGLRIAATYAVMAAVIAEWMGSDAGLGVFIVRSAHAFRTERVFAGMFIVMLYSVLAFLLVGLVRRLIIPWERHVRAPQGGESSLHDMTTKEVHLP